MTNPTPAQEEFAAFLAQNSRDEYDTIHPEDRDDAAREATHDSEDEEDEYRASQIDAAMRMPTLDSRGGGGVDIKLPPPSFDSGRATGVKGVIADARSYENARRANWVDRIKAARRSVFGGGMISDHQSRSDSEGSVGGDDPDEENFLRHWRDTRRRELESEGTQPVIRTRRTSPSVRLFGRMDEVDALGYLDAIEKVGRETVVVVFVYDHEVRKTPSLSNAIRIRLIPGLTCFPFSSAVPGFRGR